MMSRQNQQTTKRQHQPNFSSPTCRFSVALVLFLSLLSVSNGFVESPIRPAVTARQSQFQVSAPLMLPRKKNSNARNQDTSLGVSWKKFWPSTDPKGMANDNPDTRARVIAGVLATLFTWHGITVNKLNPVLASSATTLAISLWSPGLGQAAFCGSFAGMNANGDLGMILTAASLTAGLFEILIHRGNKWVGLGGKLSFQALMASNLTVLLFKKATFGWVSRLPTSLAGWWAVAKASPCGYGMLCGALGSVLTIFLREIAEYNPNRDNDLQDPVRSSAVIGILAAMAMGVGGFLDYNGAMIMFGGAFTGMSYPSRLLKGRGGGTNLERSAPTALQTLIWFGVAGAFGGLIHALSLTLKLWTGGWGGKAGSCAFAGVLVFRVFERIHYKIRQLLGWVDGPINGSPASEGSDGGESSSSTNSGSSSPAEVNHN